MAPASIVERDRPRGNAATAGGAAEPCSAVLRARRPDGGRLCRRRMFANQLQARQLGVDVVGRRRLRGVNPFGPGEERQVGKQQQEEYSSHGPILNQTAP